MIRVKEGMLLQFMLVLIFESIAEIGSGKFADIYGRLKVLKYSFIIGGGCFILYDFTDNYIMKFILISLLSF